MSVREVILAGSAFCIHRQRLAFDYLVHLRQGVMPPVGGAAEAIQLVSRLRQS